MGRPTVTRRELYERVWSSPMLQVARSLGLSDVGLAKILRRHDIPRPPRGHWARLQHGQTPGREPLPEPDREEQIELPAREPAPAALSATQAPEFHVEVAETLRSPHPLVRAARERLESAKVGSDGLLAVPDDAPLSLDVSKAALRRALLICDGLLRALEGAGCGVDEAGGVLVEAVRLGFAIEEATEVRRTPLESDDLSGPYAFGHSRVREERVPTGELTLRIIVPGPWWGQGLQLTWRDTARKPLEARLDGVAAGLFAVARRVREREERERLEAEQRRQAEERRRAEAKCLAERRTQQAEERARVEGLRREARDWAEASRLREYIAAVGAACPPSGDESRDARVAAWLRWAAEQADRLDPLAASPPSILDEDLGPAEPRRPVGGW